jgi:hypothetical protein
LGAVVGRSSPPLLSQQKKERERRRREKQRGRDWESETEGEEKVRGRTVPDGALCSYLER